MGFSLNMTSIGSVRMRAGKLVAVALAALSGAACLAVSSGAAAAPSPELAALQTTWRAAISRTPAPDGGGCFTAHYPSTAWSKVACVTAPNIPYVPKTAGHKSGAQTVGDGDDYAIQTKTLISTGVGSFPSVKGLKTESGAGGANSYTLQMNSEFFNGPVCAGAAIPSKCLTWLQYVYSSGEQATFMQYWLIYWNTKCPAGWFTYSGDCYKNSAAVRTPKEVITDLPQMTMTGSAVDGGVDTTIFADGANAYTTTGPDTVVYLATNWNGSEFNIIGDGGGSQANFNAGTKLTVEIAVTDGSTAKPKCLSDAGTTGETNNLNLGKCKAKAGDTPSVTFVESN
jgi:hypothetical protein